MDGSLAPFSSAEESFNERFVQGLLEIIHTDGLPESSVDKIVHHFQKMAQDSQDTMRRYMEAEHPPNVVRCALDHCLMRK